jgi:hypothetical protein
MGHGYGLQHSRADVPSFNPLDAKGPDGKIRVKSVHSVQKTGKHSLAEPGTGSKSAGFELGSWNPGRTISDIAPQ